MYFLKLLTTKLKHFAIIINTFMTFAFVAPMPEQSDYTGSPHLFCEDSQLSIMFCIC